MELIKYMYKTISLVKKGKKTLIQIAGKVNVLSKFNF